MKATLEFNLEEPEDAESLDLMLNAVNYQIAIYEIDQELRSFLKYQSEYKDGEYEAYQRIREFLNEVINKRNLKIY